MTTRPIKTQTDYLLMLVTLTLTCIGILAIFDASYTRPHPMRFVTQQAIWAVVGICAMIGVMHVPYEKWRKVALLLVVASMAALLAVWVPHIGQSHKGAFRWVGIGPAQVQPSELAKLAIVLYIARLCAGRSEKMKKFMSGAFAPLLIVAVIAFLVAREPDLGTACVIVATGFATLFFAGMRVRHLAAVIAACALLACVVFVAKAAHGGGGSGHHNFQMARIESFLHPGADKMGEGYQIYHSLIALGSGGPTGVGIGMGREKRFIPEPYTDFIFSSLGEEGGLIASWGILALFAILVGRGLYIASMTKDPFGAILAGGISAAFAAQALLNIGVVTASVPETGVPLPFLSYGGSSLLVSLVCVGILLSISRYSDMSEERKRQSTPPAERDFERRWSTDATMPSADYGEAARRGGR